MQPFPRYEIEGCLMEQTEGGPGVKRDVILTNDKLDLESKPFHIH